MWKKVSRKTDEEWLSIPWENLCTSRKRYVLLLQAKYACEHCGFNKRRDDGHHVVEIDHIDGNHLNNSRENLRVLCPNCHSLTPNFRNHGRKWGVKSGTRLRPHNKDFSEKKIQQETLKTCLLQKEEEFRVQFVNYVQAAFLSKEINFSKFGWVQQLGEKLNLLPQTTGKYMRKFLPEFYASCCFARGKKRILKTDFAFLV